jgi:ribose transport system substrate-binding protein
MLLTRKTSPRAALALISSGVALLLAAAATTASAATPLKIGMTFQELNNPYFVTMQRALNDATASIGAQVVVTDAHHDVSKQWSA